MTRSITPEEIDSLLPQTQCGLCGYGGCMPYAEAIVYEGANLNLCLPGGVKTLSALGDLFEQSVSNDLPEMLQKTKYPTLAVVREPECIGCTKCIQVCPVDAIVGSAKQMHTVIANECTGCELCVPACPVDCIDLIPVTQEDDKPVQYRERYLQRQQRLKQQELANRKSKQSETKRKDYILAAIERAKLKKQK